MSTGEGDYEEFRSPWPFRPDPELEALRRRVDTLPTSEASIRQATSSGQDGRRLWDLQLVCEPIVPQSILTNVLLIAERVVLLAEVDGVHVGFCVSLPGPETSDPLFVQMVGVAPKAQRRGVGLALLAAAAKREPHRDLALATQDTNVAARTLNERFAASIGASIRRVPLGTYRHHDLAMPRGIRYRTWLIQRPPATPRHPFAIAG